MEIWCRLPTFDLLAPRFEYSVYYPTALDRPELAQTLKERYNAITAQQYLAECRNMVVHGCTNPCIYAGPEQDEAGNIHFTLLSKILDLRDEAGMPKGVPLYLSDGAGMSMKEGELTEQQRQRNIEVVKATVAWAKSRGYATAYMMGADEYSGDRLRNMRETYESVKAGGGGMVFKHNN